MITNGECTSKGSDIMMSIHVCLLGTFIVHLSKIGLNRPTFFVMFYRCVVELPHPPVEPQFMINMIW